MADIIKTWPVRVSAKTTAKIFGRMPVFSIYYFALGRGKPKQTIEHLWFTYQGRILGFFAVDRIMQNDGSLPRMNRLDGGESEWQMKHDTWLAVCKSSCVRLNAHVFMAGFRGYRYFDIVSYAGLPESKVRL